MKCRELIMYILTNHLEDEPVFKDGRFIGAMTMSDAAVKLNVGPATIYTWISQGVLPYMLIEGKIYIPANATSPIESSTV